MCGGTHIHVYMQGLSFSQTGRIRFNNNNVLYINAVYIPYACEHAECVYDAEYIKELLNVCAAAVYISQNVNFRLICKGVI